MENLKDKVCFITGGSSGIGKAVGESLLEQGVKFFEMSRSRKLADSLQHDNLVSFQGDVSKEEEVKAAFQQCKDTFGGLDFLINNAGVGIPTPDISGASLADLDTMLDINIKGVFLCTREALKIMKPQKSGHILTVISMAGQRTNPNSPLYCASKFGTRGFSGGLADQVIKEGIKVTDINPGPVDSDYWGDRTVPREKFLTTRDVARVILFVLQSPDYMLIREINFDSMKFLAGK
jgi:NADP-dependent 3-hydroxy acid dehydrogenase YdfG